MGYVMRFMPTSGFNMPNREYWLASERREQTMSYIFGHSFWFACLLVTLFIGLQFLVVQANAHLSARFSTLMVLAMGAVLIAGTVTWVVALYRHFGSDG